MIVHLLWIKKIFQNIEKVKFDNTNSGNKNKRNLSNSTTVSRIKETEKNYLYQQILKIPHIVFYNKMITLFEKGHKRQNRPKKSFSQLQTINNLTD